MTSIQWYTLSRKTLERAYPIVQVLLKDPFLNQTQISNLVRIPRSTVSRIINKLAQVGAIRKIVINVAGNRAYKYEVDPKFLDFLSKNLSTDVECSLSKRGGFPRSPHRRSDQKSKHIRSTDETPSNTLNSLFLGQNIITRPDDPEELERWVKDGFFRVHGFQRKFVLRNYALVKDDERWERLALLLDGELRKLRIGRDRSGVMYVVDVWSDVLKVHLSLQFRSNSLIVTLPRGESIYVPWESFNINVEDIIVREVRMIAEKAVKVYSHVFGRQVLMRDAGWVGRRRKLRPEVAFIDPDGIIRKVYEVEGATYIEGLGYWVDGSIKSSPEIEFESVEETSKFKKAVEVLASGELEEKISEIENKVSELEDRMVDAIALGVQRATEQLVTTMLVGQRPVQDQLNEMWRRIADMQEAMNLFLMYQIAEKNGDRELADALFVKLVRKLGLNVGGGARGES